MITTPNPVIAEIPGAVASQAGTKSGFALERVRTALAEGASGRGVTDQLAEAGAAVGAQQILLARSIAHEGEILRRSESLRGDASFR